MDNNGKACQLKPLSCNHSLSDRHLEDQWREPRSDYGDTQNEKLLLPYQFGSEPIISCLYATNGTL